MTTSHALSGSPPITRQSFGFGHRSGRVNDHTVECTFFTSAQPEPPLTGTFRCDEVVQVYYANPRSSVTQARPVGLPNCRLV